MRFAPHLLCTVTTLTNLEASYEDIENQIAQALGLSCSLANLRQAVASIERRKIQAAETTPTNERQEIEEMFEGKSLSESLVLYRANKDRVRKHLGLLPFRLPC